MSKIEELNKLFDKWKEKQSNEDKDSNTIPKIIKRIDKNSFTSDGFIFGEKAGGVLYILNESNLQDSSKESYDFFWLKGAYKVENNINKSPIPRRIELMQKYICSKVKDINLQDISYMNINKRGGFSSRDNEALWNYYNEYKENFIFEEIKIIEPKIIVVCTGYKDIYKDLLEHQKDLKYKYIVNMKHPSYSYVSDKDYIEEFEKEVERIYGTEFQ